MIVSGFQVQRDTLRLHISQNLCFTKKRISHEQSPLLGYKIIRGHIISIQLISNLVGIILCITSFGIEKTGDD